MLALVPISPDNYEAALKLGVGPEDERFVSPVVKSLADAYVYQDALFRIAYEGDGPVGYILLYPFDEGEQRIVNIVRLMIDQRHQGRGLGRALPGVTLNWIGRLSPTPDQIRVSTLPDNARALNLYQSAGFRGDGIESDEVRSHKGGSFVGRKGRSLLRMT